MRKKKMVQFVGESPERLAFRENLNDWHDTLSASDEIGPIVLQDALLSIFEAFIHFEQRLSLSEYSLWPHNREMTSIRDEMNDIRYKMMRMEK